MDEAHIDTDRRIKEIEKRLKAEYEQAEKELADKYDAYFERFKDRDEAKKAQWKAGKITKDEYITWRAGQIATGQRWQAMIDMMAEDLLHVHEIAVKIAYGETYDVYADNFNYGTYDVEHQSVVDTSFTLYDHDTVARLVSEDPDLLPTPANMTPAERERWKRWQRQQLSSISTQAILQGESIPHMAAKIAEGACVANYKAAVRTARTVCTSAENAGRLDSYKRAQVMGIKLERQWVSAHDSRTRDWHRELDGKREPIDKPFENAAGKIMYPGDPAAHPSNVYNCRCTQIAAVDKHGVRASEIYKTNHAPELEGLSWRQWKKGKDRERVGKQQTKS